MMNDNIRAPIIQYERIRIKSDGDGIRTIVFFCGCPLRCEYCLNPITWKISNIAKQYTPNQLLDCVKIDSLYFQATNGGITFGGGEPLLHSSFIDEFINIAPKEWNYCVETSLAVPFKNVERIAKKVSRFIIDIKSWDEEIYKKYTGESGRLAKANLLRLLDLVGEEKIWVRVPYIPNYTTKDDQDNTYEQVKLLGIKSVGKFNYVVR